MTFITNFLQRDKTLSSLPLLDPCYLTACALSAKTTRPRLKKLLLRLGTLAGGPLDVLIGFLATPILSAAEHGIFIRSKILKAKKIKDQTRWKNYFLIALRILLTPLSLPAKIVFRELCNLVWLPAVHMALRVKNWDTDPEKEIDTHLTQQDTFFEELHKKPWRFLQKYRRAE